MVYKDWQPLVPSSRMKMQHILPDTYILVINDVITKDEGLYSVAARNPAGAVSSSAMIHVEDNEDEFAYRTYHRGRQVKARTVEANRIFGDGLRPGRRAGPWNAGRHLPLCGEIDGPQFGRQDHDGNWAGIAVANDIRTGHDEPTESQTSCPEGDIAHYVRQVLQGLGHMHSPSRTDSG